jgi:hypothetical protein
MHDQTGHTSRDEGPRAPDAFRVDDAGPGDSFLMKLGKLAHGPGRWPAEDSAVPGGAGRPSGSTLNWSQGLVAGG